MSSNQQLALFVMEDLSRSVAPKVMEQVQMLEKEDGLD